MKSLTVLLLLQSTTQQHIPELNSWSIQKNQCKILGVILNRVKPHETCKGKSLLLQDIGGYYKASANDWCQTAFANIN